MSWSTIKTDGIVLRVDPLQEADRRYRVLTPLHGKIECIGRGAQKVLAKLATHLEPFAVIDIELVRGRRRMTVISVERKHRFLNIESRIDDRLLAQSAFFLIDKCTRELDNDQLLFGFLFDWLVFLDTNIHALSPTRQVLLLSSFLLKFLDHIGFTIELSECLNCHAQKNQDDWYWKTEKGGIVCSNCVRKNPIEWSSAHIVSSGKLDLFLMLKRRSFMELLEIPVERDELVWVSQVLQNFLEYHVPGYWDVPYWQNVLPELALNR